MAATTATTPKTVSDTTAVRMCAAHPLTHCTSDSESALVCCVLRVVCCLLIHMPAVLCCCLGAAVVLVPQHPSRLCMTHSPHQRPSRACWARTSSRCEIEEGGGGAEGAAPSMGSYLAASWCLETPVHVRLQTPCGRRLPAVQTAGSCSATMLVISTATAHHTATRERMCVCHTSSSTHRILTTAGQCL